MTDKIRDIKERLIDKVESDISKHGLEKLDIRNLGLTVDMIKDLAEAEEKCWKARFYMKTIEEMGGFDEGELRSRKPVQHVEVDNLKQKMMDASPSEKRDLVRELQEILDQM